MARILRPFWSPFGPISSTFDAMLWPVIVMSNFFSIKVHFMSNIMENKAGDYNMTCSFGPKNQFSRRCVETTEPHFQNTERTFDNVSSFWMCGVVADMGGRWSVAEWCHQMLQWLSGITQKPTNVWQRIDLRLESTVRPNERIVNISGRIRHNISELKRCISNCLNVD